VERDFEWFFRLPSPLAKGVEGEGLELRFSTWIWFIFKSHPVENWNFLQKNYGFLS
jgi:hypothetical protein